MTDDDINSAAIYIKASERLATLTGMNAPASHAVQLIHATAPPEQKNSTQRIHAMLDRIAARPKSNDSDDPDQLH